MGLKVNFYEIEQNEVSELPGDGRLKFAVIFARFREQWVFCKHRERSTFEAAGGHWEPGESILTTARRELYEETGAREYSLYPVADYGVLREGEAESLGRLFYADITSFDPLPDFEIEKVALSKEIPGDWTYPLIQPKLLEKVEKWLTSDECRAKVYENN